MTHSHLFSLSKLRQGPNCRHRQPHLSASVQVQDGFVGVLELVGEQGTEELGYDSQR